MGRRIDSAAWDERRNWLERQASSGISAARFCRENGLKLSNFHGWKRKLNGVAAGCVAGDWRMHSDAAIGSGDRSSRSFVQVPIPATTRGTSQASWVEVSSAGGIVVRVPSGDLPALRMVLGTLSQENADA